MGRSHLACLAIEDAIRIAPEEYIAYTNAATTYLEIDRTEEALRAAQKAVTLAPNQPDARRALANVYADMGKYNLALEQYDAALTSSPNDCAALCSKAELLAGCPNATYRDGPKAHELAYRGTLLAGAERGEALVALATAEAECGEFRKAAQLMREALELLGPDFGFKLGAERRLRLFEEGKPYRLERISKQLPEKSEEPPTRR